MSLSLTFCGAAGEVTGSGTLLDTGSARVLVDFGMHQGGAVFESRNRRRPPFDAEQLSSVVLTHAHIDHSGRLPLLVRPKNDGGLGFRGDIWATPATIELCGILLRDAAFLQKMDFDRVARQRRRRGREPIALRPLYEIEDVERALVMMRPLPYDRVQEVAHGVSIRFVDAGHILGSASVMVAAKGAKNHERTIAFSADVGVKGAPLLHDPVKFNAADVVVLESTYGDRDHRPLAQTLDEFVGIMSLAERQSAKVLIPAFAVGRTQNLIYHFGRLREEKRLAETPVYIDSPMATEATELYRRHPETLDDTSKRLISDGSSPLSFPGLRFTRSPQESRALNDLDCCAIIISASGMCSGGRIVHHLRHNLWKPETHVVIVGFQANGTLGRELVEGAK
ncbi:MAG: MBL fold metallo-hydrolase, partial [Phycisphaerae bacterium]|nr:MBL fold metallo-hydrolase [Phycisphaerae bacterium]